MEEARTTRILLVDDHAVAREGYRRLIERTHDIAVVAEAASGVEAQRLFREAGPDVVVMDINLPGMSGLEATRRIVACDQAAVVLVFSMHEDALFCARALQAGARAYVTKASAPDTLVEAVRSVAAGNIFLSPDIAQSLALRARDADAPLSALSPTEFEVFRLLAAGRPLAEIARSLALSEKSVASHQALIKRKLGVGVSARLVWVALERGVIQRFSRSAPPRANRRP